MRLAPPEGSGPGVSHAGSAHPERDRQIVDRLLRGDNLQDIGDDFGLSRERVRQIGLRVGYVRADVIKAQRAALRDRVLELHGQGWGLGQISEEAGCSRTMASRIIRAAGMKPHGPVPFCVDCKAELPPNTGGGQRKRCPECQRRYVLSRQRLKLSDPEKRAHHAESVARARRKRGEKPCSVRGCKSPSTTRGLCGLHYGRWRVSQMPPCTVPGCSTPQQARELCSLHYQRLLAGVPLDAPRRKMATRPARPPRKVPGGKLRRFRSPQTSFTRTIGDDMTKEQIKAKMAGTLTREEAVQLADLEFWKDPEWTPEEVALAQLAQDRLVVTPFSVVHDAVTKLLGRPVFTHEFARPDALLAEHRGEAEAPGNPLESLAAIYEGKDADPPPVVLVETP